MEIQKVCITKRSLQLKVDEANTRESCVKFLNKWLDNQKRDTDVGTRLVFEIMEGEHD